MVHPIVDPKHTCQCPTCTPEAFPPEAQADTRASESHIAVRFGDQNACDVYVDGVKSLRVFEAMVGRDGWALVADSEHPHGCRHCGGKICLTTVHASVRLAPYPD